MKGLACWVLFATGMAALPAIEGAGPPSPPPAAAQDVEDVLLLLDPRPVRLRLRLSADGTSCSRVGAGFLNRLFDFLDRDGDGVLDRAEAARAPSVREVLPLLGGNPYAVLGTSTPLPRAPLDADGDGRVTRAEFLRHFRSVLTQVVHVPGGDLWPPERPDRLTGALFQLLDADGDGKLSRAELLNAERRLRGLDRDEDELLSPEEVLGGAPREVRAAPGRPTPPPLALVWVGKVHPGKRTDGRLSAAQALLRRYDRNGDGKLSRPEVGLPREEFDTLDADRDGGLDARELLPWVCGPPDVELRVDLGDVADRRPARHCVEVTEVRRPGSLRLTRRGAAGLYFRLGGARVHLAAGALTRGRLAPNYRRYLLDEFRDAGGRATTPLSAKDLKNPRYALLRRLLSLAGAGGEGPLTERGLNAWADVAGVGLNSQVNLYVRETSQGLFDLLDTDGDGKLSVRELRNAWRALREFDTDGDGRIGRGELPRQFLLTLGMNRYYRSASPLDVPNTWTRPVRDPRRARGPVWFRKMDRNGDGDVSRKEFLGPKDVFDKIDLDGDGLISPEEARRADAWFRKRVAK